MNIIDCGTGVPIVVIPGVQGRWEWMKPGIDALAERQRVITFSLADEPTARARFDESAGFWSYVEQVREALDAAGLQRATICGVSYGGLIASAFAARYRKRVSALILVSALPPAWKPDATASFFARSPWLTAPLFCLRSLRNYREIAAANDGFVAGMAAAARHGINTLRYIFSPRRMARRVHLISSVRIDPELAGVQVPTLIVTGEEGLDQVVPPALTREYLGIWPHAQVATLPRTGHLGIITRPHDFASIVTTWQTSLERFQDRLAR